MNTLVVSPPIVVLELLVYPIKVAGDPCEYIRETPRGAVVDKP